MDDSKLAEVIANDPFHQGLAEHGTGDRKPGFFTPRTAALFAAYIGILLLMARAYA